jgi:hypothetical protein
MPFLTFGWFGLIQKLLNSFFSDDIIRGVNSNLYPGNGSNHCLDFLFEAHAKLSSAIVYIFPCSFSLFG